MKNLLTFILLFVATMSNAQQYQYIPIPTEDVFWRYRIDSHPSGAPGGLTEVLLIMDGSDTVIDNHIYKKIFGRRYDTALYDQVANIPYKSWRAIAKDYLYGVIREDSQRVYFRVYSTSFSSEKDTTDRLLYDFNLTVGDTMTTAFLMYPLTRNYLTITKIDTILMDGAYRKQFTCTTQDYGIVKLIEGIGSDRGLVISNYTFRANSTFSCFAHNGFQYSPGGNACSYIWPNTTPMAVLESKIETIPDIYPNPFFSELNVRADGPVRVIIYNVLGAEVWQSDEKHINTDHLKCGLYIAVIKDDNGQILNTQKLIKK